jgi:hypothetical protein
VRNCTTKAACKKTSLKMRLGHDLVDGGGGRRLGDHAGGGCQRQRGAVTAVPPSESEASGTIPGENRYWRPSKTMVKATS